MCQMATIKWKISQDRFQMASGLCWFCSSVLIFLCYKFNQKKPINYFHCEPERNITAAHRKLLNEIVYVALFSKFVIKSHCQTFIFLQLKKNNIWYIVYCIWGQTSLLVSKIMYYFSIVSITNYHKLRDLKTAQISCLNSEAQKFNMALIRFNQDFFRAAWLSGGPRDDPFLCLFQLLETIHICWLKTSFISVTTLLPDSLLFERFCKDSFKLGPPG